MYRKDLKSSSSKDDTARDSSGQESVVANENADSPNSAEHPSGQENEDVQEKDISTSRGAAGGSASGAAGGLPDSRYKSESQKNISQTDQEDGPKDDQKMFKIVNAANPFQELSTSGVDSAVTKVKTPSIPPSRQSSSRSQKLSSRQVSARKQTLPTMSEDASSPLASLEQKLLDLEKIAEDEFSQAVEPIKKPDTDVAEEPPGNISMAEQNARKDPFRSATMSIAGQTAAESAKSSPRVNDLINGSKLSLGRNISSSTSSAENEANVFDNTKPNSESQPNSSRSESPTSTTELLKETKTAPQSVSGSTVSINANILNEVLKKPFSAYGYVASKELDEIVPDDLNSNVSSLPSSRSHSKPASGSGRLLGSADTLNLSDNLKLPLNLESIGEGGDRGSTAGHKRPESIERTLQDPFFGAIEGKEGDKALKTQKQSTTINRNAGKNSQKGKSIIDDTTPLLKETAKQQSGASNLERSDSKTQLLAGSQSGGAFQKKSQHPYLETLTGGRGRGRGTSLGRGKASDTGNLSNRSRPGQKKTPAGNAVGQPNSIKAGRGSQGSQLTNTKVGIGRSKSRDVSPITERMQETSEFADRRRLSGVPRSSLRSRSNDALGSAFSRTNEDYDDDYDDYDEDDEDDDDIQEDEDILDEIERQTDRILPLALKGDWPAIDHCLKILEHAKIPTNEPYAPLRRLVDEVCAKSRMKIMF